MYVPEAATANHLHLETVKTHPVKGSTHHLKNVTAQMARTKK